MAEDVARAVGAGDPDSVEINGKHYYLKPLTVRELTEIERDCVRQYRREYLTRHKETADLVSDDPETHMLKLAEESARWEVDDLPRKLVYDTSKMKVTDALKQYMSTELGLDDEMLNRPIAVLRVVVAAALDSERMSVKDFQEVCGYVPKRQKVGYVNWWATATFSGMVCMVYAAIKDKGTLTKQEIIDALADNQAKLQAAAGSVEAMSSPAEGNI
jgi:hypothetical protein